MRSQDAKSIPVPTVFFASGAATNAAKPADQRVALKGKGKKNHNCRNKQEKP